MKQIPCGCSLQKGTKIISIFYLVYFMASNNVVRLV